MKIQGKKSWETIPTKNKYYRVYTKRTMEWNRKFKSRLKYMEIQGYIKMALYSGERIDCSIMVLGEISYQCR